MHRFRFPLTGALLALLACTALFAFAGGQTRSQPRATAPAGAQVDRSFGRLPIAFEPNAGRVDGPAQFLARGKGYTLFLTPRGSVLGLERGSAIRTTFMGARPAEMTGERKLPGVVNSYVGDRSRWRTGLPTFGRIAQRGIYPGIDVVYHGRPGTLEYDFRVAAGADATQIAMQLNGARSVRVDRAGDLVLGLPGGSIRQERPRAFQDGNPVPVGFRLAGNVVRLQLGRHDPAKPLLIDPQLAFSTYLGGSGDDAADSVAVDADGAVYVTGSTKSNNFPGAAPANFGGGQDVFVTKLSADGSSRVYSTYLGGSGDDSATGIAVRSGEAYVSGNTPSTNFPTASPVQTNQTGNDAFATKLTSTGAISYSTYIGGGGSDGAAGITVDSSGNAYVGGETSSTNLPTTPPSGQNAVIQPTDPGDANSGGDTDGWVAKLPATPTTPTPTFTFLTYFGSAATSTCGGDAIVGLAVSGNNVYIGGNTAAKNMPGSADASSTIVCPGGGGFPNVWTARLSGDGKTASESLIMGGTDYDNAFDLAASGSNVALTGYTSSNDWFGDLSDGGTADLQDAFVLKVTSGALAWGDNIGGVAPGSNETGLGVAFDGAGNVYVTGPTSGGFPLKNNAGIQSGYAGGSEDAFITKFRNDAPTPVWSTYLGGAGSDTGFGLAAASTGVTYVVGDTSSSDFNTTSPVQQSSAGGRDAWIAKIAPFPPTIATASVPDGGKTTSTSITFTFSHPDSPTTFKCFLDRGTPNQQIATCGTPKTYSSLADGPHTFELEAIDDGGSTDENFATWHWTVDTTPPNPFTLSEPADGAQTGLQPTFTWNGTTDDTTRVVKYRLVIDGGQVAETTNCCSLQAPTALPQGQHTWKIVAVDEVGLTRDSPSRTFTPVVPLTAKMSVSPNPALIGGTVGFDGTASNDGIHTIAKFEWDLDGDGSFERDTGATATTTNSYATAGTVNVGLRVTDTLGQTATTTTALKINTLTVSGQFGVSINNGAQYTRDPNVVVTCVFPATTSGLLFSNDGGFFAPVQFKPAKEIQWKLDSSGPERLPKIVYVRFQNGPIVSETHTDDIILDETPPKVEQASVAPAAGAAAAVRAAKLKKWKIKVKATDSNSGVDKVQVAVNKKKPTKLTAYKRKLTVKLATRPKYIRATDRAGNFSPWKKIR